MQRSHDGGGQRERDQRSRGEQTGPTGGGQQTTPGPQRGTRNGGRTSNSSLTLRAVAVAFGLHSVLLLFAGFSILTVGSSVPVAGTGFQPLGLVVLLFGGAYGYAGYGVWRLRARGWQVGVWLAGAGALLALTSLLAGGVVAGFVGFVLNCVLGWGLHSNRAPFRREGRGAWRADGGTAATGGDQRVNDTASGRASERRGRQ
ncbi:MAG: hypothetical protein J07HX64_01698 [halophilic archaeon J07HX64]|jgi:hypothetical protein|nr:MAG: hypothetical protein J07HX64_01698 [halophilic archaeon J07HX64]